MSFQININSTEDWNNEILQTPGLLQVVEMYQKWSGPCKAIQGVFKKIYFEMSDSPLKFYTACVTSVPELSEYDDACEPIFVFYRDGAVLDKIVGVKGPELQKKILQLLE
mmetsp:Transcript_18491/g.51798  ORF Transcript_18491/g.51798 Transcript_18491/m.51798 type:complete len:110 (-) Transcript_18491:186-515(-)|eukprot:CAMPEP_0117680842 /NCGR_PEP_ID=MMETSP0804-20121206/18601_1 /TAXON_ID=1074897 /ORGANISM="Tetraselmis astigmatica, Strain CCMP880" /LENGTH=109 /DNA_ID=CAMNT_0005490433 /DNA_START=111 /DNA_END=440 /DNA_ORIENTATION=-